MPELLGCPFCDAPARFVWTPEPATAGKVKCTRPSCGATSGAFDHSTNAIAAWNTRAPIAGQAELVEALEFYADESGWNEPPVETVNHEIFGKAYQNQASKVRQDRGRIARAALSTAAHSSQGRGS